VGFTCQHHDDLPREAHDHPVSAVLLGGSWLLPPPDLARR
jgi:5-formyltetrahydrofolate cyclo-ligase